MKKYRDCTTPKSVCVCVFLSSSLQSVCVAVVHFGTVRTRILPFIIQVVCAVWNAPFHRRPFPRRIAQTSAPLVAKTVAFQSDKSRVRESQKWSVSKRAGERFERERSEWTRALSRISRLFERETLLSSRRVAGRLAASVCVFESQKRSHSSKLFVPHIKIQKYKDTKIQKRSHSSKLFEVHTVLRRDLWPHLRESGTRCLLFDSSRFSIFAGSTARRAR